MGNFFLITIARNKKGGGLPVTLIFLAVLVTSIAGYFVIKRYEINLVQKQEQKIKNSLIAEQVFGKYLFLAKNYYKSNWRLGLLAEAYTSDDPAADTQTWTHRNANADLTDDIPYQLSYMVYSRDADWKIITDADGNKTKTYTALSPDQTLTFDNPGILCPNISCKAADNVFQKCDGIRIENIPVGGSYVQVEAIEENTTEEDLDLQIKVFIAENPIIY